ncbi:MAG TPA: hypothetical protein VHA13_03575 [Gammaproteobacteria bacterium]|nr:hypothetical protein [Gammaproteobacteria bacterium]
MNISRFLKTYKYENKEPLNGTQKAILDATFKFYIDQIIEEIPESSIMVLEALTKEQFTSEEIERYKKTPCPDEGNVWDMYIKPWHDKIHHPQLEKRAAGNFAALTKLDSWQNNPLMPTGISDDKSFGIFDGKVYYFENGFASNVLSEPVGGFSLTSRNDMTAPPVTRQAAFNYIKNILTTNIRGLKQNGNHYSYLKPNERISEKQWFIGITADSIYIEGMTSNDLHFIDYFKAEFSTPLMDSIILMAKSIYPFQIEENLLEEKIPEDIHIISIDSTDTNEEQLKLINNHIEKNLKKFQEERRHNTFEQVAKETTNQEKEKPCLARFFTPSLDTDDNVNNEKKVPSSSCTAFSYAGPK